MKASVRLSKSPNAPAIPAPRRRNLGHGYDAPYNPRRKGRDCRARPNDVRSRQSDPAPPSAPWWGSGDPRDKRFLRFCLRKN
jgi:hypothetical protein